ncbi:MAG: hypothetical protein J2P48_11670 [Alphaproteobacteria bacterium]|nr:hypothetical protein [Alphaproteobacteria bacterium]
MADIAINGHQYRCGKMPTITQRHVVKRLMPVLQGLSPLFAGTRPPRLAAQNGELVPDVQDINVYDAIAALSNTIGMMSDADADYVIDSALDVVSWKQGNRWMPLRAGHGGAFMLGDADDLATQLRLTWEVLVESLGNFSFAVVLPSLQTSDSDQTANTQSSGS